VELPQLEVLTTSDNSWPDEYDTLCEYAPRLRLIVQCSTAERLWYMGSGFPVPMETAVEREARLHMVSEEKVGSSGCTLICLTPKNVRANALNISS
jgi:hypothetical protein